MRDSQTAREDYPSFKSEAGILTKKWHEELNTVLESAEDFV